MRTHSNNLAVYTTIYRDGLKYLPEWFCSIQSQSDMDFELWIGLDGVTRQEVEGALGTRVDAQWVAAPGGSTPAQVRDRALKQIVEVGRDVVLVDCDDILHSDRVARARQALRTSELAGCALEIMDERGLPLGDQFNFDPVLKPSQVLPRNNVFGFSNSAYRCDLLDRCLPIPQQAILVDWYLATRAWLFGAELEFDHSVRMKYRQYDSNTAHIRLPFWPAQILSDSALVRLHFQLMLSSGDQRYFLSGRWAQLLGAAHDVEEFEWYIHQSPTNLHAYLDSLNRAVKQPIWWTSVAYAPLAHMWKHGKGL